MQRLIKVIAIGLTAGLLNACGPVMQAKSIAVAPRPATSADRVEILGATPTRAYTEVAQIVVTGETAADAEVWQKKLRSEAAKHGADAVLILDAREAAVVGVATSYRGFTQVDVGTISQVKALALAWR